MHVSQPAVTRTIRELETAPNVKLFEFDDLKGPEYAPKALVGNHKGIIG